MRTWQGVTLGLAILALLGVPHVGWARERPLAATTPMSSSRSLASVPDDVYWDDRFAPLGVSAPVYAIAVSGGDVYVGGAFVTAGGIVANGIAKWNTLTNTWSALGDGVQQDGSSLAGTVRAIAISGDDVYVGGYFSKAGDGAAYNIARWNAATQTWSALGSGTNGTVNAIAVSGNRVYVGGSFYAAGGITVYGIAQWDTTTNTWSALGSGVAGTMVAQAQPEAHPALTPRPLVPAPTPVPLPTPLPPPPPPKYSIVNAIAAKGNDVYVGGNFITAGGVTVNGIAKWDALTQTWSALGSGVIGTRVYPLVYAIAINGSNVYAGGSFSAAGGASASGIAKWDTTTQTWSALGNGVGGTVSVLALNGNAVYVGGKFLTAGDVAASNIAQWDTATSTWSALGSGTEPSVAALGIAGDGVYVGGSFLVASGHSVAYLARWNTGVWSALDAGKGSGCVDYVNAVATNGSEVYVGGTFTTVGSVRANRIARWNASAWSALGEGIDGKVLAMAINGNDVYVGGDFASAGGLSAQNIAKWNAATQTWSALGSGVYGSVSAIAISGDDVYVGGDFTSAGGISASRIAKWNATTQTWSALGAGVGGSTYYPRVSAIAISGNAVYVAGDFIVAGNVIANGIAQWNAATQTWSALGSGVNDAYGWVNAITLNENAVYIGGNFTLVGGVSATNVAKWNTLTNTWSAVGGGFGTTVNALTFSNGNLYAGGNTKIPSVAPIARWNGCAWLPLGSGVNDSVNDIAASGDDVYVVGLFTMAGAKPSTHIAHWNKPTTAPTECHSYYFPFVTK